MERTSSESGSGPMSDLDSIEVSLRASLKPADYENLSVTVRTNLHIPPAEVYAEVGLPVPSTPKQRAEAFAKLREELFWELKREIISVFDAAGYEAPIEDPDA